MLTRSDNELLVYTLPSCSPAICLSTLILAPPGKECLAGAAFEPPVWAMNPSDDEINELVRAVRPSEH
jgi:hypothetical protein